MCCHLKSSLWLQGQCLVFVKYCVNPVHEVYVIARAWSISYTLHCCLCLQAPPLAAHVSSVDQG